MAEQEDADFDNMDQQELVDYFNNRINRLAMTLDEPMRDALIKWTTDIGWWTGYIGTIIQIRPDIALGYGNAIFCLGFNAGRKIALPAEYVTDIDDLFDIWNTGDNDTNDADEGVET